MTGTNSIGDTGSFDFEQAQHPRTKAMLRRTFLTAATVGGVSAATLAAPSPASASDGLAVEKPDVLAAKKKTSSGPLEHEVFNVRDFGAVGDGTADDTAAIQQAIDAAQAIGGGTVYLPSGTFKTTSTLLITGNNMSFQGEGASSILACSFAAGDILRVAQATGATANVANGLFYDFAIISTVQKTSGAALALDTIQDFRVINVHAISRIYANNLWDSFTIHNFTFVSLENLKIQAQNRGIALWGETVGADVWITGGTLISFTPIGVQVGGGVGGVYFNDAVFYLNGTNVLIDDTLAGMPNREIVFNEVVLDGSYQHNVEIKENGLYVLTFQNTWFSNSGYGGAGHPDGALLRAHTGSILHPSNVTVSGCKMFNAAGSGIYAESGAWTITGNDISINAQGVNGGYGVLLTGGASQSVISGNSVRTNGIYPELRPVGVGIQIDAGVDNYVITSNLLTSNATAGLVDNGGINKVVDLNLV
ncbi:MAG: hypothetical protein JWP85_273 [Rhodoglobus sp.]|nr:hypothetical protein [Rhodoglobus sp.]